MSSVKYWREVPPFSELHVYLKAFTYWDSSAEAHAVLHSPSSTPSKPVNLRSFILYQRHLNSTSTVKTYVRWNPPNCTNGVIERYKIRCWVEEGEPIEISGAYLPVENSEYVLENLDEEKIYHFQVLLFALRWRGIKI